MNLTIDTSPLQAAMSKSEVKAYFADPSNRAHASWSHVLVVEIIGATIGIALAAIGYFSGGTAQWWETTGVASIIIGVIAALAVGALGVWVGRIATIGALATIYRRINFATANGLEYADKNIPVPTDGAIFSTGHERQVALAYTSVGSPAFSVFNYLYKTGTKAVGKQPSTETTHQWNVIRINLPRRVPHIVLDSATNNYLGSNLPQAFSKKQKLELEGDFNKYFTVYCAEGYGPDALYILTPDVMAALVDNAGGRDVELVDDHIYLYQSGDINLDEPARWHDIPRVISVLASEFGDQTKRYSDDRVGDRTLNMVAPSGRRITQAISIPAAIAVFAILGLVVTFIAFAAMHVL